MKEEEEEGVGEQTMKNPNAIHPSMALCVKEGEGRGGGMKKQNALDYEYFKFPSCTSFPNCRSVNKEGGGGGGGHSSSYPFDVRD